MHPSILDLPTPNLPSTLGLITSTIPWNLAVPRDRYGLLLDFGRPKWISTENLIPLRQRGKRLDLLLETQDLAPWVFNLLLMQDAGITRTNTVGLRQSND